MNALFVGFTLRDGSNWQWFGFFLFLSAMAGGIALLWILFWLVLPAPTPEITATITLREKFAANPKVLVHGFGLWDKDGQAPMALAGCDGATFLYAPGYTGALSEPVGFRDIAEVMGRVAVDLVYLNCEGAEFGILSRLLEAGKLAQVRYLMVQFHPNPTIPGCHVEDYEALCQALVATHTVVTNQGTRWHSWRRNG